MVIYIIAGVIGLAMSVTLLYAVIKIWRLLEDLVNSGAFPAVQLYRLKKEAREIVDAGTIENIGKANTLVASLKNTRDSEANVLAEKITQLLKLRAS